MRPLRTHLRHIGRFASLVLDLTDLTEQARIVNIDGENGSGKSTLASALTKGALFRKFGKAGSLNHLATARDSMLETVIAHGSEVIQVKHLIDGKEGVSVLLRDGEPENKKAKKREFKSLVAQVMPPEALLCNTIWRSSKFTGFMELDDAERRDLILLATGATQWEAWAVNAREMAKTEQRVCEDIRTKLSALGAPDIPAMEHDVGIAKDWADERHFIWGQLIGQKEAAVKAAILSNSAKQEYERQLGERQQLVNSIDTQALERAGLLVRIESLKELLGKAPEIRAAVATVVENAKQMAELREELSYQHSDKKSLETRIVQLQSQLATLHSKENSLERLLDSADAVKAAVEQLPQWRADRGNTEREVERLQEEIETLSKGHIAGKDERIASLRDGLTELTKPWDGIACYQDMAAKSLELDDSLARGAIEIPKRLEKLRSDLDGDKDELDNCRRKVRELELLSSKQDELVRARNDLDVVKHDIGWNGTEAHDIEKTLLAINANISNITAAEQRIAQASLILEPTAARADALARAEATLAELEPRVGQLDVEIDNLQRQLDDLPEPKVPEAGPDIAALERRVTEAQAAHSASVAALAALEERLRQARETIERIDALRVDLVAAEREAADWTLLAKHLGKDGIQASLVDAAGPELTETANYLLHTCFGNRWSLFISTQRDSSDGKKRIEECEVRVIDQGDEQSDAMAREGIGETFCDGEQEILNLALQLALTHLARNAGIVNPDIFLDEPATALHQKWRPQWMKMLRLAADLTDCQRIYLITHLDDLKAMCDARIVLENGTARIE